MCFSASASFTAASLLAVIGSVTTSTAKKQYRMLASVPLLFAFQQMLEGFLWLAFVNTRLFAYKSFFTYGFLFFAFIFWPLWAPLSVYILESQKKRKNLIKACIIAGIIVASTLFFYLVSYGATAQILDHHIAYHAHLPKSLWLPIGLLYVVATVAPFFITRAQWAWLFGVALFSSYLFSLYFYFEAFTSVWCFFAAILSVIILMITKVESAG